MKRLFQQQTFHKKKHSLSSGISLQLRNLTIDNKDKQRIVFSGIQPTGNLHLGNYLGAIKNWVILSNTKNKGHTEEERNKIKSLIHKEDENIEIKNNNCSLLHIKEDDILFHKKFFCVVDLHAITMPQDPIELKKSSFELICMLIACGLNPIVNNNDGCHLFLQSHIPAHSQLSWIFGCNVSENRLKRMHHYKDKKNENTSIGLVSYPILMASDILLYSHIKDHSYNHEVYIPVGDDQKQHLELSQEVAHQFNYKFKKNIFNIPKGIYPLHCNRIMNLRDGTKKMSKSDPSDLTRINLIDTDDMIINKIKKAKTDILQEPIYYDKEKRPEISNLMEIYVSLEESGKLKMEDLQRLYPNLDNNKFKKDLSEIIVNHIRPIRENYFKLLKEKDYINQIIKDGADNANEFTQNALREIMKDVGFYGF
ncbi:hypothetical protein ABK040_000140 [Willaertia magna]